MSNSTTRGVIERKATTPILSTQKAEGRALGPAFLFFCNHCFVS
jgi:hypothetical protein